MVKMKAPEGACSVTAQGVEYDVKKGFVEVDPAHVADLRAHGFEVPAAEEKAAKPKADKAAKADAAQSE